MTQHQPSSLNTGIYSALVAVLGRICLFLLRRYGPKRLSRTAATILVILISFLLTFVLALILFHGGILK